MDILSALTHGNQKGKKRVPRLHWPVSFFVLILELEITPADLPTAENILVSCLVHPRWGSAHPYLWIQTQALATDLILEENV